LIFLSVLGGCRGAPSQEAAKTEVWWFTWTPPDERAANEELARQFEAANPGIKVKLTNDPALQAMQKLQTMIAGGSPPDVMSIHGAYFVQFALSGALMDLSERARADPELALDDFYPGLLELCKVNGRLYSLPRYTSVYALFFNRSLFDAAGLPYPGSGPHWTWDDFLATAKALTKDTNNDGRIDQFGCVIDFWGARIYPWLWQNGGQLVSEDKSRCLLNEPEAREALQFLVDLKTKYRVTPPSVEDERRDSRELFKGGKVAMYMSGPWDVQEFKRMETLQWEVAPLPMRKQRATLLGLENYALAARSKHPEAAWALLRFLLSPAAQLSMARKVEKMPSRRSVAEKEYLAEASGYNRRVFVEAVAYGRMPPNLPRWAEVDAALQRNLDAIWQGTKSVAQGCAEAEKEINAILQRQAASSPAG